MITIFIFIKKEVKTPWYPVKMTNATHRSSGASVDLHVNQNLESNQLARFGNVGVETRELEEEIRFLFFVCRL